MIIMVLVDGITTILTLRQYQQRVSNQFFFLVEFVRWKICVL